MHLDCFKKNGSVAFHCITNDMNEFQCTCAIFTQNRMQNDIYCSNASYFGFWLDKQGPVENSVENEDKWDGYDRNLANLSDHCFKSRGPFVSLYCNTYNDEIPYSASCSCLNSKGFAESFGFFYEAEYVYPNKTMYDDDGKLLTSNCRISIQPTKTSEVPPMLSNFSNSSRNNNYPNTNHDFQSIISNNLILIIFFLIFSFIICVNLFLIIRKKIKVKRLSKYFFIFTRKKDDDRVELFSEAESIRIEEFTEINNFNLI